MNQTSLKTLRVDQVGSLLRRAKLKEVYSRHGNGEVTDDALARIQDESVKEVIAKQEAHGLSILTDGEFRRLNFQTASLNQSRVLFPRNKLCSFKRAAPLADKHSSAGNRIRQKAIPRCNIGGPSLSDCAWRRMSRCGNGAPRQC